MNLELLYIPKLFYALNNKNIKIKRKKSIKKKDNRNKTKQKDYSTNRQIREKSYGEKN